MLPFIEEWRDIPSWSAYRVSNWGRVRSLDRTILRNGRPARLTGRILRLHAPLKAALPYVQISLSEPGHGKTSYYVHHLVLSAFVRPPRYGEEACHGSNGTLDNSLPNLAWGSRAINLADRQYRRWGYLSSYAQHIRRTIP